MTNATQSTTTGFVLSDSTYNFFKKLVQFILPAFGTFYFALAGTWGLPAAEQVVGTTVSLATFLGAVLGISAKNYNASDTGFDGSLVATKDPETGKILFSFEVQGDPYDLLAKKSTSFKVVQNLQNGSGK